jgi:para-aminobenzoate synthetase component 1
MQNTRPRMIEQQSGVTQAAPQSVSDSAAPLALELNQWLDPWDICRQLAHLPHLLFLDSAASHPSLGRYSFIAADPFDWLCLRRGRIVDEREAHGPIDPFAVLDERLKQWHVETVAGLPPFQGGAAGLFGYDLCHHIERLPRPSCDEFETPDLAVGFYDWVAAFDHIQRRAWIISTGLPETAPKPRRDRALQRLRAVRRWLGVESGAATVRERTADRSLTDAAPTGLYPLPSFPGVFSNFDQAGYLKAARRAIEYVHAGDCFQVNLSQRLLHRATLTPLDLYDRLRQRNSAPFAAYFDLGEFAIASASPERFLRVEEGRVETRPIKGTRPRGRTADEDARQRRDLRRSAKDRAENVMIIDLLRNDLGRVCEYGSVQVPAVCRLESYRTVHHLVSEVVGRLRPGLGPIDLLRAAFPGGSVTGAPKVRAMEIIAELEPTARGPYCGSLGYIGFDGSMDTNILIRTFTIGRGWMQFPVGGGIVADSTPQAEYEETLHKAEGLLRALL